MQSGQDGHDANRVAIFPLQQLSYILTSSVTSVEFAGNVGRISKSKLVREIRLLHELAQNLGGEWPSYLIADGAALETVQRRFARLIPVMQKFPIETNNFVRCFYAFKFLRRLFRVDIELFSQVGVTTKGTQNQIKQMAYN